MSLNNYYVYITTNPGRTVLYTGVTNELRKRVTAHRENKGDKKTFAGRYYCYNLVYYEHFPNIKQAIQREKEIKNMSRKKKEELIAGMNPKWNFLQV